MNDARHQLSVSDTITSQLICDDLPWRSTMRFEQAFEESFDNNYYHSEKPAMSDQFSKLRDILAEFKDELVFAQKNVCSYYR